MRLLLICHEFPPLGGGTGNAARALATTFAPRHPVTVLTGGFRGLPRRAMEDGVEVVRVRAPRRRMEGATPLELVGFAAAALAAGSRLARSRRFDGCLALHGVPAAWVALPLSRWLGIPYVVSLRGADVPGFLGRRFTRLHRLAGPLTRLTWRGAARVVANSEGLRALAERTALPLGVRVEVIPNGVDTDFYRPGGRGGGGAVRQGLFAGRLTAQKGLDILLEALGQGRRELEGRLRVELVGGGEREGDLRRRAEAGDLGGLVTFTPWLAKEALRARYQAADLFVLPSLDEGMSNALLEAMACGLPVVATAAAGTVELVKDGVSGFLVAPGDAAALARALVDATRVPRPRLAAMGEAGRSIAEGFGWSRVADAYLAWFAGGRE